MFQKLLVDGPKAKVTLDWFGIGSMRVVDQRTGVEVIASPALKTKMLEGIRHLETKGVNVRRSVVLVGMIIEQFGVLALSPNDLLTRAALSQPAGELAVAILQQVVMENE